MHCGFYCLYFWSTLHALYNMFIATSCVFKQVALFSKIKSLLWFNRQAFARESCNKVSVWVCCMCCGYFTVFTPPLLYLCMSVPFVLCKAFVQVSFDSGACSLWGLFPLFYHICLLSLGSEWILVLLLCYQLFACSLVWDTTYTRTEIGHLGWMCAGTLFPEGGM